MGYSVTGISCEAQKASLLRDRSFSELRAERDKLLEASRAIQSRLPEYLRSAGRELAVGFCKDAIARRNDIVNHTSLRDYLAWLESAAETVIEEFGLFVAGDLLALATIEVRLVCVVQASVVMQRQTIRDASNPSETLSLLAKLCQGPARTAEPATAAC
jgi:hypothetical protein